MIKWNEGREAKEKCESHNFEYGEKDLTLICKYLGNGEQDKNELENRLLDFCSDCRREGKIQFDPFYREYMIPFNNAVETASKKTIQDRFPIPITLNESGTIKQIDNEEIQRLLFVMLVVAKYFHILIKRYDLPYTTDYRVDMADGYTRAYTQFKILFNKDHVCQEMPKLAQRVIDRLQEIEGMGDERIRQELISMNSLVVDAFYKSAEKDYSNTIQTGKYQLAYDFVDRQKYLTDALIRIADNEKEIDYDTSDIDELFAGLMVN